MGTHGRTVTAASHPYAAGGVSEHHRLHPGICARGVVELVVTIAADGTLSIEEAARMCRVSDETLRRRLRANALPGAFRAKPSGMWRIPLGALVLAGFDVRLDPAETAQATPAGDRVSDFERRAELAETIAAERLARITQLEAHVADLRNALEILGGVR